MYRETTQGIQIEVQPEYVPAESHPTQSYFVFAYHIKVTNLGQEPAQLVSRRWIITDGHGEVREVEGPGVIGQQPWIQPGETFKYSSFCPLPTPTGNMRGQYSMASGKGTQFEAKVPLFFLRDISQLH